MKKIQQYLYGWFIRSWINRKFFKKKFRLKGRWTEEGIQEISAMHGLNAEKELTRILTEELHETVQGNMLFIEQPKNIKLIMAMDTNNLIGNKNDLPWKLPADLKYFKQQTLNQTIVMGRKTCESLPFRLPGRRNIVLTTNKNFQRNGFEIVHNISQIHSIPGDLTIIGGSTLYELFIDFANELLITKVHDEFEGDTYFHPDLTDWQLKGEIHNHKDDLNLYDYSFLKYRRIT